MTHPASPRRLHVNYEFVLDFAARSRGRILDYGCGAGEIVREGLERQLDIYGCDVFYGGSAHSYVANSRDLVTCGRVLEMVGTAIPFPDESFDCVVSNQVFEHVEDYPSALREIYRVLKPGGKVLSLFGQRECIRDGHCGVPFAHRFAPYRFGYYWLLAFRCLGFGYHTKGKTRKRWAKDFQEWLLRYCHYHTEAEINASFRGAGFTIAHCESDYVRFRAGFSGPKALRLMPAPVFYRLGFSAFVSEKA